MKTFVSALALACLSVAFISPVSAQTRDQSYWNGYRAGQAALNANALVINGGRRVLYRHSTSLAHDVYDGGIYVGSDPDLQIRSEIARDREDRM